jgi:DNA-binding transcriptional ArsR family regulator
MPAAAAPDRIHPGDPMDRVAHALADGTRRRLLRLVRDGERAAGELAAEFPAISRPAVSQHLRVLETAGLVTVRPDGNRRLYRARVAGLAEVWRFIDDMWSDRLERLKHAAEREAARTDGNPREETTP